MTREEDIQQHLKDRLEHARNMEEKRIKNQSAVDWIVYEIKKTTGLTVSETIVKKAKEMEEHQIFESTNSGRILLLQNPILDQFLNNVK